MNHPASRLRDGLVMAAMPLFFSSNLVIGRPAVGIVEPWTLAFFRWFGAFIIILPIALRPLWEHREALYGLRGKILLLGFLGMWVCGAIVYLALRYTTATNATLIYTTSPVMIILLEWLFRGRRIRPLQAIGVVLAFAGVTVIILEGEPARLLALRFNIGDFVIAAAAFAWSIYSVILKQAAFSRLPIVPLFAAIIIAGWLTLLPFAIFEAVWFGGFPTTGAQWTAMAGLALFSSVLSFGTYQYSVKRFGPVPTGMVMYLLPVYGVGLAMLFLGESLRLYHAAGLALVLPGLVLATLAPATLRQALLWRTRA